MFIGAYKLEEMTPTALPPEVQAGFNETLGKLNGPDYIPVLYLGHQIVAGINYMLICKQRVTPTGDHLVKVVLNHNAEREWSAKILQEMV